MGQHGTSRHVLLMKPPRGLHPTWNTNPKCLFHIPTYPKKIICHPSLHVSRRCTTFYPYLLNTNTESSSCSSKFLLQSYHHHNNFVHSGLDMYDSLAWDLIQCSYKILTSWSSPSWTRVIKTYIATCCSLYCKRGSLSPIKNNWYAPIWVIDFVTYWP